MLEYSAHVLRFISLYDISFFVLLYYWLYATRSYLSCIQYGTEVKSFVYSTIPLLTLHSLYCVYGY